MENCARVVVSGLACVLLLSGCSDNDNRPTAKPTATATAVRTATPTPNPLAQVCVDAGGSVTTAFCCTGVSDFPNTCRIGACGCAPAASRAVSRCECPNGACWDGDTCVSVAAPTVTPTPNPAAQACLQTGGSVTIRPCCASASDFADTCGPVSCECFPPDSGERQVQFCECQSAGDCWNGSACTPDIEE